MILGQMLNFVSNNAKHSRYLIKKIRTQIVKSCIQQVSLKNKTNVQIILNIVEGITLITLVLYLT